MPRWPSLYRTVAEDIKAAIAAGGYAAYTRMAGRYLARGGLRRVRLQMMQTAPLAGRIATALADGQPGG